MADPATRTAIAVLVALAAALVAWFVMAWRSTPYSLFRYCLYLANTLVTRLLWRAEVVGKLDLPDSQGAVIVSNHQSGVDPLLLQLANYRVVHWLVAREYYNMPVISKLFKHLESIPVNRGGIDTAATKLAIRYAQEGGLVGLFPEGRVNQTEALLLPGRPGAALIALRARVPVIPIYVEGVPYDGTALGSFFMTGRARVTIGRPIDISSYYERDGDRTVLQELTKRFLKEIAKLAGVDDFEPQLAGKHWKPSLDDEANIESISVSVRAHAGNSVGRR